MDTRTHHTDRDIEPKPQSAYFCSGMNDLEWLTHKSIAKEKRETLRLLQHLRPSFNWMIPFFLVQWIAAGYVMQSIEAFPVMVLCYFLMGCSVVGLPVLMHEACHSLLSKKTVLNHWLGFLCGLPGLVSVSAYRSIHLIHHSQTRTEKDPDDIEAGAGTSLPKVLVHYIVLFAGIYFYLPMVALTGYRKAKGEVRFNIVAEYTLIALILATVLLLFPLDTIIHLWVVPLLIAGQLSNVRGLAEHGLMSTGNPFIDTRTVLSNRFVSFMMCNLNYHLEHHLFPGIPWYNLPKVHHLLREEYEKAGASVYRSYTSFLIDFFKLSWSEPLKTNARLLPAHIRDEVCL